MKSIRDIWAYAPLNKKIAIIFLTITIVTSVIVGLVSYQLSKNVITDSSIEKSQNAAKTVANTVDEFFNTADQTFISIYSNQDLITYLDYEKFSADRDIQKAQQIVETAVSRARQLNNAVKYINIYGMNGFAYTDYYYYSEKNTDYYSCDEYYSGFGLYDTRRTALWIPNQNANIGYSKIRLLTLVRYTRNIYSLKITGIMTMGISEASLCKQYLSTNNNIMIVDSDGYIVSDYDKTLIGTKLQHSSILESLATGNNTGTVDFTDDDGTMLFATYSIIPSTGWYLLSVEDYFQIFKSSYNLLTNIIIILLATIIISSIVLLLVSKALTASLSRLFTTMEEAMAGNLSARFRPSNNDEVNRIGIYLNDMLRQISENIRYREQSERLARISDLRLLQSQINPHLLYNTLDSVHYNLETASYKKAAEILKSMSSFFKLSLSQGDILIPIERELSLIRVYLDIQRICREKNIELIISGEKTFPVKIPKMTIQPIVENSIMHAFHGDEINGRITIDIHKNSDKIIISVTDNGIGMTNQQCSKINENIQSPHRGLEQKHYGLWNVNQRLKNTFGNNSGIVIQSEFGEFTKTIITIYVGNGPEGGTSCIK